MTTMYKSLRVTEDINRYINRWLGSGVTVAQITTALNNASTALAAVNPVPTHDITQRDLGPTLKPTQPRTGGN